MTIPDFAQDIRIRPTLIMGLGGTGTRVAVALKARLEERLGEASNYDKAIKFLCFDTANDAVPGPYPDNPAQQAILTPDQELVRITDVPLFYLMQARDSNQVFARVLPKVLHSTQIDQGAQQVRRLGRVALLYHYQKTVRGRLQDAIDSLRHPDAMGRKGQTLRGQNLIISDQKRLRAFVICSICGGTGSGIFIDMAYIIRHLAGKDQPCEVIGMLFLPETFPEISTTGKTRIRANAYAALLDLEYFMQRTPAEEALYRMDMPNEQIEVSGAPFSSCYLVSRKNTENLTLKDKSEIAPVMAEGIYSMIATPLGEQMDATLDNVRVVQTAHYKAPLFGTFRAFYSAMGISQIVFPEDWARRYYQQRLQRSIIKQIILASPGSIETAEVTKAFTNLRETIRARLEQKRPDFSMAITYPLANLRAEVSEHPDPLADLQAGFRETERLFNQRFVAQVEANRALALVGATEFLETETRKHVNDAFKPGAARKGLAWTLDWLTSLNAAIDDYLKEITDRVQRLDSTAALNREVSEIIELESFLVIGKWRVNRRVRSACQRLIQYIEGDAANRILDNWVTVTLNAAKGVIERLRQQISSAMNYWDDVAAVREAAFPRYDAFTQPVLSEEALKAELNHQIEEVVLLNAETLLRQLETVLQLSAPERGGGFAEGINSDCYRSMLERLQNFCEKEYATNMESSVIARLGKVAPDQSKALLQNLGKQAQPLLEYIPAMIESLNIPLVKVVGAYEEDDAKKHILPMIGDAADVRAAPTGNARVITYLVTHHGVPAVALSNFEEYRSCYERMTHEEVNAIFHLDEALENEPYDPGSIYFVELESFDSYFARALAFQWIVRLDNSDQFVLSEPFYNAIERICSEELARNHKEVALLTQNYGEAHVRSAAEEALHKVDKTLRQFEQSFKEVRIPIGDEKVRSYYQIRVPGTDVSAYNLALAHRAFNHRLVQPIFIRAFQLLQENLFRANDFVTLKTRFDKLIESFLMQRGYLTDESDQFSMVWSQRNQGRSYLLEMRLSDVLLVYYRLDQRNKYAARLPAHYYADVLEKEGALAGELRRNHSRNGAS